MSLIMKDGVAYGATPTSAGFIIPGDNNGEIKVVPEGSTPYNVTVIGWDTKSDTDEKVKQVESTDNKDYEVLLSGTASTATKTEGTYKSSGFIYNPSNNSILVGTLQIGSSLGLKSSAFGHNVSASGNYAHAEGMGTTASGNDSHSEGISTIASGHGAAHAEGAYTNAIGWTSHAEGSHTIANHYAQHVFGMYNIEDSSTADVSSRGNYIEIVGNGSGQTGETDEYSNARTLDWSGNEWLAGTLTQGSSIKLKTNISPISLDEIYKILELNAVKFDYINQKTNTQKERGFIAEDVFNILPNLVTEEELDDKGNMIVPASINYIAIIPYLVEICKRQQQEINDLKILVKNNQQE